MRDERMPSPDRSPYRFVAYGFLTVIVLLAAIPGYLVLAPPWRPLAVRLACALVVVACCVRMVGIVRRSIEDDPPSPLDAPPPAGPPSMTVSCGGATTSSSAERAAVTTRCSSSRVCARSARPTYPHPRSAAAFVAARARR